MIRRLVLLLVMLSMVANSNAQSLPSRIGQEIAAVIKSKVGARGFAANDPRFGATVGAVGAAVTEIAVGVVAAGTAPAWGTILASAAVAGAVGYGISALTGWLFNSDGTVKIPGTSTDPGLSGGGSYYTQIPSTGAYIYGGDPIALIIQKFVMWNGPGYSNYQTSNCSGSSGQSVTCFVAVTEDSTGHVIGLGNGSAAWWTGTPPTSCPGGSFYNGSGCAAYSVPSGAPAATKPVADALAGLSDADKAKPLPAQTVADMADAAFKQAASKPGYAGVPYSMTDPVTAADVSAARAANPSIQASTVGDLAQPIPQTNPLSEPTGAISTGTNPASSQPQVNLGIDPAIGSPTLEATPTAQQIIDPLAGLGPTLKNWSVPSHQALCPTPAFDLFSKHIVMDQQCSMFDNNRAALYNAMLVAWVLIALFIILSA